MNIVNIKDKDSVEKATLVLSAGGVLVFPTDTVYGIGCVLNDKAIEKLYKIKNRSHSQPTAVLMSKSDMPLLLQKGYGKYPVGQITIIAHKNNYKIKFPNILLKDNKIGVRFTDDKWLQGLLNIVGPIVASSANKKGERAPQNFNEIDIKIIKEADLVVKNNERISGRPSVVYDLENKKILRE